MQTCMYCQNHCEGDLFAQEPTWSCAWCRATAHVRCYHAFHAHALAVAGPQSRRWESRESCSCKAQEAESCRMWWMWFPEYSLPIVARRR